MKTPEEIIRKRMLRLGRQYIAELVTLGIVDMMEEYAQQFKNLPESDSFPPCELICMCHGSTQVNKINEKFICCTCNRPLM